MFTYNKQVCFENFEFLSMFGCLGKMAHNVLGLGEGGV
jgi:hypothetical protein